MEGFSFLISPYFQRGKLCYNKGKKVVKGAKGVKRLLIGQFGNYDATKHERDFRNDFFGVEACSMTSIDEIHKLVQCVNQEQCQLGIHFPFRSGQWRFRDPQYLSQDIKAREESYEYMNKELDFIQGYKPTYVLHHIPKPALITDELDLTQWRFGDSSEYMLEEDIDRYDFFMALEEFIRWFEEKGKVMSFIPILEFDFIHPWLYEDDSLIEILGRYPLIKLCIDFPRLHLQDELIKDFNPLDIIKKYGSCAWLVHLSQGRLLDNHTNNHYPALPSLKTEDGWADLNSYFHAMNSVNDSYKLLFEHRSDRITDQELEDCYTWTKELMNLQ